jgi:uncharacterized protein YecE (DUF72 family)
VSGAIKIGVAGWSYDDWQGIVYPENLSSKLRVEYLAGYFDLIEINSSFYGHIRPAVGEQWCRMASGVNPRFTFTAKLNRAFTHSPVAVMEPTSAKTIRPGPTDEQDAKAGLDSIAEQGMLGAVLVQFPISFKCTDENRAYVEKLVSQFRKYPLVLEIRHASWNQPEILAWLTGLNVGLCNIDQPLIGRAIRPGSEATSAIGYIRLHGRNYKQWFAESTNVRDRYDYLYSPKELEVWKGRVLEVAGKTKETYVVANNHNLGKAAVNALELLSMFSGRKVKVPDSLCEHYPELKQIADREGEPENI